MAAGNLPNPQAMFDQYYDAARRDEIVGVLLALFLGGFGAHQFYLRRTGLGVFYLLFCWTPIPWLAGFIECFFMPGRIRVFNAIQAASIAGYLGLGRPPFSVPQGVAMPVAPAMALTGVVAACGHANPPQASFCSTCGAMLR